MTAPPWGQCFSGELIDHVAKPDLSTIGGDVDLEVQRPHLIGAGGG